MAIDKTNPIRVGIIGLGRAGWGMQCQELDGFQDKFKVVAACDIERDRRELARAKFSCRTYRQIADILADPDVELVSIATRTNDHFEHANAALSTGKYVLLEKPMCMDYTEALKLRAASVKAGGRLFIRQNRRFEPGFVHMREVIDSGILGEVYDIRLVRGFFARRDDWQTVRRCGGGQLLNWGPHLIDQALQLLGPQTKLVFSDLKRVAALGDAEDHVRLILKNAAGVNVIVSISDGRILRDPEYFATGTKGAVSVSGDKMHIVRLDPDQKLPRRRASVRTPVLDPYGIPCFGTPEELKWIDETIDVAPTRPAGLTYVWEVLYDAIRRGKPYPITIDDVVEVMRVISAAKR